MTDHELLGIIALGVWFAAGLLVVVADRVYRLVRISEALARHLLHGG